MNKTVKIRADADSDIGYGHIMRTYALACMLKKEFDILFYCKSIPVNIKNELINNGFKVNLITSEDEYFVSLNENCIAVLDGYNYNLQYQQNIKKNGAKLVFIDDLHSQEFVADLIINHAPLIKQENYICTTETKFALGQDYALLRPAFIDMAKKSQAKSGSESIFICFGGADPHNLLEKTIEIAREFNNLKRIIAVGGSSSFIKNNHDARIEAYNSLAEKKMAELISESDIAIVPSSTLLFEAIALGCKTVSGYFTENQKYIFEGFKALGAIYPCDFNDTVKQALKECIYNTSEPKKYIDGKSDLRISQLFKKIV